MNLKKFPPLKAQLKGRLRFVGFALLLFSFICFIYVLIAKEEEKLPPFLEKEGLRSASSFPDPSDPAFFSLNQKEKNRFILYGISLAMIGATATLLSYRKKIE